MLIKSLTDQVGGGTLMINVTNGQTVFVRDKTDDTFKIDGLLLVVLLLTLVLVTMV